MNVLQFGDGLGARRYLRQMTVYEGRGGHCDLSEALELKSVSSEAVI